MVINIPGNKGAGVEKNGPLGMMIAMLGVSLLVLYQNARSPMALLGLRSAKGAKDGFDFSHWSDQ
jgi:hypothetical protein